MASVKRKKKSTSRTCLFAINISLIALSYYHHHHHHLFRLYSLHDSGNVWPFKMNKETVNIIYVNWKYRGIKMNDLFTVSVVCAIVMMTLSQSERIFYKWKIKGSIRSEWNSFQMMNKLTIILIWVKRFKFILAPIH